MASLFIGFLVESKWEIRFRMASFSFSSCLMRKRVAKSEAILQNTTWYLSGAASRVVSLSNYCIWCLFFIPNLMKLTVVYAAILFTHVCKIRDNDLTEYQLCYKLTDLWKAFRNFLTANRKKTFQRMSSYNSGCKRKVWAIFLPRVRLWKKQTPGSRLKT